MEITFLLLPLSLVLAVVAFVAFAWSVLTGQYDDVESAALRPLSDEDEIAGKEARDLDSNKSR